MDLKLSVETKNVMLRTIGEVFVPPLTATSVAVVRNVVARCGAPAEFPLDAGTFEYHFHVENGLGELTVVVTDADGTPCGSKTFDTKLGLAGKVLSFEVP